MPSMAPKSLIIALALVTLSMPIQAAMPMASEDIAITAVVPNHATANGEEHTIELYNSGALSIDLHGWTLTKFNPGHVFEDTCTIELDGPLAPQQVGTFDNTDTRSICYWSPEQGQLFLYDPSGHLVSTVSWGDEGDDHAEAIPSGHALERCFLVNPDQEPAQNPYWASTPEPRIGEHNDPCLE